MKKIIVSIVSIFSLAYSFAQDISFDEFNPNPQLKGPSIASLETYAASPVSLAKGSLGFNVPICAISGRDLSVPVSMSYRAGVKIYDTSEYTGQGWTLMAGGLVTRTVIGQIDPYLRAELDHTTYTSEELFLEILGNQKDPSPDLFSYNFNGKSGQFLLKKDLVTPYYIKDQRNWSISISDEEVEITIEDGTRYVFNEILTSSIDFGEHITHDVTTSWYLTEIISAKFDESITFSYSGNGMLVPRAKNNSFYITPAFNRASKIETTAETGFKTLSSKKVNEISLYSGVDLVSSVKFESNTLREDTVYDTYALSKISLHNENDVTPIKYFVFDIENVNNDRIFLKSIQEFSGDGTLSKPPYQFEYISPELLPSRTEYKADHWGYYSDVNGGEFPKIDMFPEIDHPSKEPSSSAEYGSLRQVTFPTGGTNRFYYGLNEYDDLEEDGVNSIAGGIRIESQVIYEPDSNVERTINYTYKVHDDNLNETEKSSGQITEKPVKSLYTPYYKRSAGFGQFGDSYTLKSMTKHIQNSWVNYTEVKEEEVGNGFKIHKFNGLLYGIYDYYASSTDTYKEVFKAGQIRIPLGVQANLLMNDRWPFEGQFITNGLLNKPISITVYKKEGEEAIKVSEEKYEHYRGYNDRMISGSAAASENGFGVQSLYVLSYTSFNREYSLLKSKETIQYDANGENPISTKFEYEYNEGVFVPTKTKTTNSIGEQLTKKTKYSINYVDGPFRNLLYPIEEQIWERQSQNYKLISGRLYTYSSYQPKSMLSFEHDNIYNNKYLQEENSSEILSANYSSEFLKNGGFKTKDYWFEDYSNIDYVMQYEMSYYDAGNIKEVIQKDGKKTVYIWGYHKMYPIAKLENVSYEEVSSLVTELQNLSDLDNDRTIGSTGNEGSLRTKLEELRTMFSNDGTKQVTTYTYDPLIGITSITDFRGQTVYYDYDSFNRLKFIKDRDGNILKENQYNYKN